MEEIIWSRLETFLHCAAQYVPARLVTAGHGVAGVRMA